jgi:predicted dehydrogenase
VKAIWCEKPLAGSVGDAEAAILACERRGIVLVVSHVRRWLSLWKRFGARLDNGEIGTLRCLRVAMPNRLWSIGSHAVDLAMMLGGNVRQVICLDVPALAEDGEPARPALLAFESGAYAAIEVTGRRDRLIVEAEAIGDKGRLRAREDTGEITFEPFEVSRRFAGYFEPGPAQAEKWATMTEESPFIAAAAEVIALAREPSRLATCSGREALATMRVLDQLAA